MSAIQDAPLGTKATANAASRSTTVTTVRLVELSPDLEQELREATADIERGDYIELTPEQLERCIDGEWPWPDESQG